MHISWIGHGVALLAFLCPLTLYGADKADAKAAKKRLLDAYWLEVRVESHHGVAEDPVRLCAYGFREDDYVIWSRRGELSLGRNTGGRVIVNAEVEPMQVDVVFTDSKGQDWVTPCIFKFDGGKLIVVEPTKPSVAKLRKDGVYDNRPTDFLPTKENNTVRKTLNYCSLYAQD